MDIDKLKFASLKGFILRMIVMSQNDLSIYSVV